MTQIFTTRTLNLGGIPIRRAFPQIGLKQLGPWVFFDHLVPATLDKTEAFNVDPHPHIGLATFTYLFTGQLMHRDSLGTALEIKEEAINLMVSGEGITHSEREPQAVQGQKRDLHGIQLWLALPEANEQQAPEFHHYGASEIPEIQTEAYKARLLMGTGFGQQSPVKTFSPTFCADIYLSRGHFFEPPVQSLQAQAESTELGIYLVSGTLQITETNGATTQVNAHEFYRLQAHVSTKIQATEACHFICLGGEPIGKRYIDWNFVASNKALIEQAKDRWEAQAFPKVPGEEGLFIPLPSRRN